MSNLKNRIKLSGVVLSCLASLIVLVSCLSVSVKAETLFGVQSSSYSEVASGTNLPSGALYLYSYQDWLNVPFERTNYTRDYFFSGSSTSYIPFKVVFPSSWAGRYITGRWSVQYSLSRVYQFYYDEGLTFAASVFNDFTERFQIENQSYDFDGLSITCSPQVGGGTDIVYLSFVFNDYYVPISAGSNTGHFFGFQLPYTYSFSANYYKTGNNTYEPGLLTALTSQVDLKTPVQIQQLALNGGSVQLSNEYYTLLQALYDSDIDTLLTGLNSYLTSWIGEPSSAITNNWADFSAEVINKLGAIAAVSGSSSPLIPAINQIYQLLFDAMGQSGYLTTWFSDFYTLLNNVNTGITGVNDKLYNRYGYSTGTYMANVYFALTGTGSTVGYGITQTYLNQLMTERWASIIVSGLEDYFGAAPSPSEAAEYSTEVDDVVSGVDTQHTGEQAAYDSAMAQFNTFVSAGFFSANTQIMPASVWYVAAINAIHSRLGKLAIPITVSFALGLIVAILGRVNRFAILTRRNSDPA